MSSWSWCLSRYRSTLISLSSWSNHWQSFQGNELDMVWNLKSTSVLTKCLLSDLAMHSKWCLKNIIWSHQTKTSLNCNDLRHILEVEHLHEIFLLEGVAGGTITRPGIFISEKTGTYMSLLRKSKQSVLWSFWWEHTHIIEQAQDNSARGR